MKHVAEFGSKLKVVAVAKQVLECLRTLRQVLPDDIGCQPNKHTRSV